MNAQQAEQSSVKVAVRVRPFNTREKRKQSDCIIRMHQNSTVVTHPETLHLERKKQHNQQFTFDYSFWSHDEKNDDFASQETVFEDMGRYILDNIYKGYNCALLAYGQTGCLDPDTLVMMYDGSTKAAKDVIVGDVLMGDDSAPRNVLKLFEGTQEMYDVIPEKGDSYRVNKDHVLTLEYTEEPFVQWCGRDDCYKVHWYEGGKVRTKTFQVRGEYKINKTKSDALMNANAFFETLKACDKSIDIPVHEYLKKSKTWKRMHKGVRRAIDFKTQTVPIDPYMLGLWLGDGSSGKKWRDNPFYKFLQDYNLLNNKHIPQSYLVNSRENRLKLLAGLIDSDGYLQSNTYEIVQKSEELLDGIVYLSRSLGFGAYKNVVQKAVTPAPGDPKPGTYYRCFISGIGISDIPVLLPHKKATTRQLNKNVLHTDITLESTGPGLYNGFMLDGNHRFLLGDFTATHNSGKSYSMMGGTSSQTKGLIPRICESLFEKINNESNPQVEYEVEVSYLEIYAEKIRDLIDPENTPSGGLRVREHPKTGPYVEGLTEVAVDDYYTVRQFMMYGNKHRATASTKMNDRSSRSHAVFTVNFKTIYHSPDTQKKSETTSKIQLVDLAGSERVKDSGVTGVHLKEASNINQSLTTLGRVIGALARDSAQRASKKAGGRSRSSSTRERSNSGIFVPFRDSSLTWLLKDSLGGNSKTIMIAAISPAAINYDETLSTLQYAASAKKIVNSVCINADLSKEVVDALRVEIQELKERMGGMGGTTELTKELMGEIVECKEKIDQSETLLTRMGESWEEKIQQAVSVRGKTIEEYRRHRNSIKKSLSIPFLINLDPNADIMKELMVYLTPGTIESKEVSETLYADFMFEDGLVYVIPRRDNWIHVNDMVVDESTILDPGDKITTEEGDSYKFRYPSGS